MLYISLHRFGERWYPETGEADEVGEGAGVGRTVNVPWTQDGLADADYMAAFKLVVLPVLRAFSPDLLLISAGFDAAECDPRLQPSPRQGVSNRRPARPDSDGAPSRLGTGSSRYFGIGLDCLCGPGRACAGWRVVPRWY